MDEFELIINGPGAADTMVPPPRYAYPVSTQPPLPSQTPVTYGDRGWWLIDELLVVGGPLTRDGREMYELAPLPEWGAALVREHEQEAAHRPGQVVVNPLLVEAGRLWVYRDALEERTGLEDLPPADPMSWFSRVRDDAGEPPHVMRPRPARELPSLSGRTVRVPSRSGGWMWMVAVSEPVSEDGEICVPLCSRGDYWQAVYLREPRRDWLHLVPLHRVWTY